MAITFYNEGVDFPPIDKKRVSAWIKTVAKNYEKNIGGITYLFCSDTQILETNKKYLQHDYYTDIITFDYSEKGIVSGDIFISLETVKTNSEQFNTPYLEELHRVIIHGILHLCGQNDKTKEDADEMRKKENEALKILFIEGENKCFL